MAKEAQILFEFENSGNKLIHDRPINYSDHYSDRYFNISMIQEIIDGVITNNEAYAYHLRSTYIKDIEFIWQKDISNYYNVYKHLKIYGDNSNFKIKYSSDDTNPLELPISNNEEFYLYKSGDPITLNVKCQDLWYKITVTDQNTLTYTTSDSSDFNLLPSPEKNNIVYKDDLDRYTYSKIKVGDNLKGKRLGLRNDEKAVNKFLYNITKDNYMHPIIRGKDGSNIAYENKTENSYIGFYIKYANTSTYHSRGTVSFIGSGYRPSSQTFTCTEDFIVTSISAGWDDILRVIDEVPLLSTKEDLSNKVISIPSSPTVDQYPTARAVVDYVNELVSDTGWIISTVLDPNNVCTYNNGQVATGLQIRKVGKTVYLNLTLSLTLDEGAATSDQYLLTLDEKYRPTQTIYFTTLLTCSDTSQLNQLCTVTISPNGKIELPNYIEIARKQTEMGGNTLSLNHLVSYPV